MGHTDPSITVTNFRGYYDDGAEGAATPTGTAGTNWTQSPDVNYRCRLVVAETAGGASNNTTYQWQYNYNGGGWNNITTTSSVVRAFSTTHFTDNNDTTQQVGSGTFVTPNEGFSEDGANAGAAPDIAGNDEFETELCFQIRSADTTAGLTLQLRVLTNGLAPAGTPTLPTITVGANRNVVQNPAQGGDLTTCSLTESSATVTKTILRQVTCTTATLQQKFGGFGSSTVDTYISDGSDFTTSVWTNGSNANDGSTSTFSDDASNAVGAWRGSTIPVTGDDIVRVRGRSYISTDDPPFDRVEFMSGSQESTIDYGESRGMPTTGGGLSKTGTSTPSWTDYYEMNPNATWGEAESVDPYDRSHVDEYGVILTGTVSSTDNRHYTTEFEVTTGIVDIGYMSTATDVDGTWTNEANAVDGSTSTAATFTGAGGASDFTADVLRLTVPSQSVPSADIYNVCVRVYGDFPSGSSVRMRWLDGSDNVLITHPTAGYATALADAGGARWSQWYALTPPAGGWTSANADDIKVEIIPTTSNSGTVSVYRLSVAYLSQDFNPQGSIVTKTIGRVANGSTVVLPFTTNDANVPIDRTIDADCNAEQTGFVANKATVTRPLTVQGKPARPKKWKPLPGYRWLVNGSTSLEGTYDAGTVNNMLDGDLGTSYDMDAQGHPWVIGTEPLSPQSSATAVPAGIKVRVYISGTPGATTSMLAGWDYGNQRAEETLERYELEILGPAAEVTGGGGGNWSQWYDFNLGYNYWGNNGTVDVDKPLRWQDIEDRFVWYSFLTNGGDVNLHAIEILVEEAEPANYITGYVDASYGWEDEKGQWRAQANAWDGSTTTFAYTEKGSGTTWADTYFQAAGNTLTQGAAEDEIKSVWMRARLRGQYTGAQGDLSCILYPFHPDYIDDSGDSDKFPVYQTSATIAYGNQYFTAPDVTDYGPLWDFPATNTAFWSPWYKIDFDTLEGTDVGGQRRWKSWEEVQKLGFRLYRGQDADGARLEIAKVEYVALAEPPNSGRPGSNTKKDRGVLGAIEATEMAGTQATVTTGSANRNVTCTTETISLTETASTINAERGVLSTSESTSLTENASTINLQRGVNGVVEAAVLTEAAATVDAARGVTGVTEATTLTETGATVNRARTVVGVTELLSLTENAASVSFASNRTVNALTEAISLAEAASTVNAGRGIGGNTEVLALAESSANVAANRGVISATEATTLAEQGATVNAERGVVGTTEVTSLADNDASVNLQRGVNAATETSVLNEQTATVNAGRGVAGVTEAATLTEANATVNRARTVVGVTEALSLTESAAIVTLGADRDVTGITEAISLTENAATINAERGISATAETTVLSENSATVNRARTVAATTELVTVNTNNATVETGANRVVEAVTEAVTLTESAASVNRARTVAAVTEVIVLVESPASVLKERIIGGAIEAIEVATTAAAVARSRGVQASTEAVTMAAAAATIGTNTPRTVAGITEIVELVTNPATISTGRAVVGSTQALTLTEPSANINAARHLTCVTEAITIGTGTASITKKLAGTQPGSAIFVHPNPPEYILVDGRMIQL